MKLYFHRRAIAGLPWPRVIYQRGECFDHLFWRLYLRCQPAVPARRSLQLDKAVHLNPRFLQ